MNADMINTHPDVEQLARYMESPESGQHNTIRKHLMACDHCRTRVDKLIQLEFDIKHYVPRFRRQSAVSENTYGAEQNIERYIDNQLEKEKSTSVRQQINSNPESLKAALHYAVHSVAMNKNMSNGDSDINLQKKQAATTNTSNVSIFSNLSKFLQWPMPAWSMAPVTLLLAAVISLPLVNSQTENQNNGPLIAKYQDSPVISYASADIPKGSIGFFHDAKSRTEPFNSVEITVNSAGDLSLRWQPVEKAKSYVLNIYRFKNSEKLQLASKTTAEPITTLNDIHWENGKHYQWQISGLTNDGLKFSTHGDFIFVNNNSD